MGKNKDKKKKKKDKPSKKKRADELGAAPLHARPRSAMSGRRPTLTIDIGGTGIKMLALDASRKGLSKRMRELTPKPAHPEPVLEVIAGMLKKVKHDYERVSVGFPGVVIRGVAQTAPNLDTEAWRDVDIQTAIAELSQKPTRVINDADLQGYGVITGKGLEMAITLGTGLGSAIYSDGHLVPNLEWGHHPFGDGQTYEERIRDEVAESIPKEEFQARVVTMLEQMKPIFNYERIYIGGGNAKILDPAGLPADVTIFKNVEGMQGGMNLWEDTYEEP